MSPSVRQSCLNFMLPSVSQLGLDLFPWFFLVYMIVFLNFLVSKEGLFLTIHSSRDSSCLAGYLSLNIKSFLNVVHFPTKGDAYFRLKSFYSYNRWKIDFFGQLLFLPKECHSDLCHFWIYLCYTRLRNTLWTVRAGGCFLCLWRWFKEHSYYAV